MNCSSRSVICTRPTMRPTANASRAAARRYPDVGRDRVKRLMREHDIQGAKRRGKPWRTTIADSDAARRHDLIGRDFTATSPEQLYAADFTYLRC